MAKFNVLTPLGHDGEHYEPGDTVDIANAKQSKLLVDSAVIEPAPTEGKDKPDAPKKGKQPVDSKAKPEADGKITGLRITSSVDGFRCADREWTGITDVPVSDLSVEQVGQLMAAPELAVTDVLIDADSSKQG